MERNRSRRRALRSASAAILLGIGSILLLGTVWGAVYPNDHRERLGVRLAYADAIEKMDRLHRESKSGYEFLAGATRTYAAAIRYVWPKEHARVGFTDNWILFGCGYLDPWLVSSGRTDVPNLFRAFQSTDYTRGFRRGFGICSQNALGLIDLLHRRYGVLSNVVSLGGHVVVEAESPSGRSLHDPSLGVSVPFGLEEIDARRLEQIRHRYEETPFPRLGLTFDAEGNSRESDGVRGYHPTLYRIERVSDWLKWLAPLLLLGLGRRLSKRVHPSRESTAS